MDFRVYYVFDGKIKLSPFMSCLEEVDEFNTAMSVGYRGEGEEHHEFKMLCVVDSDDNVVLPFRREIYSPEPAQEKS